jgi:hypothetical protein
VLLFNVFQVPSRKIATRFIKRLQDYDGGYREIGSSSHGCKRARGFSDVVAEKPVIPLPLTG